MAFNFKLLIKVLYRTFWRTRGTNAQLTPKRMLVIIIVFPLYVLIELINWLGFVLDAVFFSKYCDQEIREPVFIVGVMRSGTTFLHRLMAREETHFTSMKHWEILFAPSIIQKKIFNTIGAVDRFCGSPLSKLISKWETRLFGKLSEIHKFSIFEAEEDEIILLHAFSSLFLVVMFPFVDIFRPYFYFDLNLSNAEKARIMGFYKRCVQKHLYVFGKNKQFLSKNPLFCGTVQSLNETFPDAKFICLVRSPLEAVPSALSLLSSGFNIVLSPCEPYPLLEGQLEMINHHYHYPLEKLAALPPDRQQVINYQELVTHPAQTVIDIYKNLGFAMTPALMEMVRREEEKARAYKSKHEYSPEQFGLTREAIVARYEDIFERFGFNKA